jgi:nitric oxide reductase subunit B
MNRELEMAVSARWLQVAVLTFGIGFGILGYLAYRIYADQPPVPDSFVRPDGGVLFTREDILVGQRVFGTRGLMEQGTIFGHGAYLGPDFTAEALHRMELAMQRYYGDQSDAPARIHADFKTDRFDGAHVHCSAAQVAAWNDLLDYYETWLGRGVAGDGLRGPRIEDSAEIRAVAGYVAWSAWVATAPRPGRDYSYTNNWPPDPVAGNTPTADALVWSAISLIALLAGIGATMFAFGRSEKLGWLRDERQGRELVFRSPNDVRLTPSQRATVWYFVVVVGLFLAQGLCGGANAHYHAETSTVLEGETAESFTLVR